jgi:ATP-dependent DNA helicase RecG
MKKTDVLELIANGESSGAELKRGELLPVRGTSIEDLDWRRCEDYLVRVKEGDEISRSSADWMKRYKSLDLIVDTEFAPNVASIAGILLFGKKPGRCLPNAGIRVTVYPGTDKDYNATCDEFIDYSITELQVPEDEKREKYKFLEPDFFRLALEFVGRFVSHEGLDDSHIRRTRFWDYPPEVIRELIVNACIHRDWTNANTNRVEIYSDRMEITSYGGLPNTMTLEKVKAGQQYPRNPILTRFARDYGYMDDRGMGIRRKVIPLMIEHNKSEPVFEIAEDYFKVILQKLTT